MSLASDYRAITDDISLEVTGPRTLVRAGHSHRRGGCILALDIQADIRPPGSSREEKEEWRQEKLTTRIRRSRGPLARWNERSSSVLLRTVAPTRGGACLRAFRP